MAGGSDVDDVVGVRVQNVQSPPKMDTALRPSEFLGKQARDDGC